MAWGGVAGRRRKGSGQVNEHINLMQNKRDSFSKQELQEDCAKATSRARAMPSLSCGNSSARKRHYFSMDEEKHPGMVCCIFKRCAGAIR